MIARRSFYRTGLHQSYKPYYDALCGILPDHWQPTSGLRTLDYQAKLFAQGRDVPGKIVTKAPPGMSYHNYGLASDWWYFPSGIYTVIEASDPVWKEYIDAVEKVGLKSIEWERPHNQLDVGVPVGRLLLLRNAKGDKAVADYIEGLMNGKNPTAS